MASDSELVAVCNFLNELSLTEIIRYDEDATWVETESNSDVESFVTDITTDEDDSDTDRQSRKTRRPKSEAERVRQREYDRKCRTKRKTITQTYREGFMNALNELIGLMHIRLARTEKETNMLSLAKKKGVVVSLADAVQQVTLNQGAIECIMSCASHWELYKNGDSGKFFLRGMAKDIRDMLDLLLELGEQLNVATVELKWRVEGRTTGVWV
ncbi:DNA binding protein [Phytophthora megakarya]|uniref:DNA binding protein n=1 Tax=Phytophthora megakarya TaxID=4795 RepID=A0A225VU60_9STRA|nr:DNA binding protein [Phytophthora megakarya]